METLFLTDLTHWHWAAFSAVLAILDVLLGASFFLVWLGLSALTVATIVWLVPGLIWEYQFLLFTVQSIASSGFWHLYLKKNPPMSDKPRLNRRNEQYIGRVFTLVEPIVNGRGKITVEDSNWRVEGEDLPIGAKIKVIDVDGVILKIEKCE